MDEHETSGFIFLDGDLERKQLVGDIRRVRREVLTIISQLPEKELYTPRYHGWTPAAMLAHLNFIDNFGLLTIRAATIGIRLPLSSRILNGINKLTTRFFRARLVATSAASARKNEERIIQFIMNLPIEQFTRTVYYPMQDKTLIIERAVQAYFLHHWREHLHTIRETEAHLHIESSDKHQKDAE